MISTFRAIISSFALIVVLFSVYTMPLSAQDRAIHLNLRFKPGTSRTSIVKRVLRGTSHVYHLRARKGQHMSVLMETGENTSLTIYSIRSGQLDGADGVHDWDGYLPETGEYIIEIGTDVTAGYVLSVTID